MSGTQKLLVFQILVAALAALSFIGIYVATDNWYAANAGWALLSLTALQNRIRGDEPLDERDKEILARASLIGYGVFWLCFVLGCVGVSLVASPSASIPAAALGFIPMAGFCLLTLARSLAGLVLYARGS